MNILTIPEKVLYRKTKPVSSFDAKLRKIVVEMTKTLESCVDPVGVGLAAPQVGLALQIFISKPTAKSRVKCFINLQIIALGQLKKEPMENDGEKEGEALEGCLSIPRIWGPITRADWVELAWQDIEGKAHKKTFTGFEATIIQHEMDHLEGILFTHRSTEQKGLLYEERNKKLYELTA